MISHQSSYKSLYCSIPLLLLAENAHHTSLCIGIIHRTQYLNKENLSNFVALGIDFVKAKKAHFNTSYA